MCPLNSSPVAAEQLAELGLLELGGSQSFPGSKEQQDLIDSLSWVSRIRMDAEERPAIAAAIDDAKAYADLINSRCVEDEPMFSVVTVVNRTRQGTEARVSQLAEKGELLKNAPSTKGGYFKVASILE